MTVASAGREGQFRKLPTASTARTGAIVERGIDGSRYFAAGMKARERRALRPLSHSPFMGPDRY